MGDGGAGGGGNGDYGDIDTEISGPSPDLGYGADTESDYGYDFGLGELGLRGGNGIDTGGPGIDTGTDLSFGAGSGPGDIKPEKKEEPWKVEKPEEPPAKKEKPVITRAKRRRSLLTEEEGGVLRRPTVYRRSILGR